MGRLQQQNPNNYGSNSRIHSEFENVIRYLVSAERGALSLPEMMKLIFDKDGQVDVNLQIRFSSDGLEYRLSEN